MAEGLVKRKLSPITQEDVKEYYAQDRRLSLAACTAEEDKRYDGEIGDLMKKLHPEVTKRWATLSVFLEFSISNQT